MQSSYSQTNYPIQNYEVDSISKPKPKSKKKCIIISSIIAVVLAAGIVAIIVGVISSKKNKEPTKKPITYTDGEDSDSDSDSDSNSPESSDNVEKQIEKEVNITYTKNEFKIFNIEKNISSTIIGEEDIRDENFTFYYKCVFGIKNINEEDNYYEGFFAILSIVYYNRTNYETKIIYNNTELNKIINQENVLRNLQKKNKEKTGEGEGPKNLFVKIEFYKNGTYKNIFRPNNLQEKYYDEIKEKLDIIIPKIYNDTFVASIDKETIAKKRLERKTAKLKAKLLNKNKKQFNNIIIRRRIDEIEDENGIKIKDINSTDEYYIDCNISHNYKLIENDDNDTLAQVEKIGNNTQKYDTYKDSEVYSDFTKYRGSFTNTSISTIINNGTVTEIISRTFMNISKQEFLKQTDKDIYSKDNYINEKKIIGKEDEINITNPNNNVNIKNVSLYDINGTGAIYNLNDANSIISIIDQHFIVNTFFYDEEIINNIYTNYLDNFAFEEINSNLRILNSLKSLIPKTYSNKYEIIEDNNNTRQLEEIEMNKENIRYYGLKNIANRKDVFQTNFLGLDIVIGLANEYLPGTGQLYNYFKTYIGDYKISDRIKSYKTNQPIIIENIQQMSFKLLQMMYLTHTNFKEQNIIFSEEINSIIKPILDSGILNIDNIQKYANLQDYYSLITKNRKLCQTYVYDFLNNLTIINNNFHNSTIDSKIYKYFENILEKKLNNYINNITNEINNKIEDINITISKIVNEIETEFNPHIYEDYEDFNLLIKQISSYINDNIEKYLKSQLNEGQLLFFYKIQDKINKTINFNQIKRLENIIQENKILSSIYTTEEKNFILSNISDIKNFIQSNITSSIYNTLISVFNNYSENINISNISKLFSKTINNSTEFLNNNIEEYNKIEEYFKQIEKIDQTVNDIITNNIKNDANILFNQSYYSYNLINNITLDIQNITDNFAKILKTCLIDIKNEKISNLLDFHNTYFENNMIDFYNISNQKNEFILNEKSINYSSFYEEISLTNPNKTRKKIINLYNCSSFDIYFLESVDKIIANLGKEIIDNNFILTYEYLEDTKSFVEECVKECIEEDSIFDKFINFLSDCDCEYYLDSGFINDMESMSTYSYNIVVNELKSDSFLDIVKAYYYSFKEKFKLSQLNFNQSFINNNYNKFSYLNNLNISINFNFTQIKEFIINKTISYLQNYGMYKKNEFINKFDQFSENKKGIKYNKKYDIKIEKNFFSSEKYTASSSANYIKVLYSKKQNIINHLRDEETKITNNYLNKIKYIQNYYDKYIQDLVNGLEVNKDGNNFAINIYFNLEKYSSEITKLLDNFTNSEFVEKIINEYQKEFNNITSLEKLESLKEYINNLIKIYNSTPYLIGNEEIKNKIYENIEQIKYISNIREINKNYYHNYIKNIIINKIEIFKDLNKKISNYILSDLDNKDEYLKNELVIIGDKFNEIEKTINSYKTIFKTNLNNVIENINNTSFKKIYENINHIDKTSSILKTLVENNSYNNSYDNISIYEYLNQIKIKKEIDRIIRIIYNNEYSIEINKNLIPNINIDNANLFYEQMKYNIMTKADQITNNYVRPQSKEMLENYFNQIFNKIDIIYKNESDINEIIDLFNELINSKINTNFSEEVEKDLNVLYYQLFDLVGKSINLKYSNKSEINFENQNKTLYNKIYDFLNIKDIYIDNNNKNNSNNSDEIGENNLNEIFLILMKRLKEKKIKYFKSYLNKFYEKYENFNKDNYFSSIISKLFEDNKKEELYSYYDNIYTILNNNTIESLDLNISIITPEEIKKMTLNSYQKNFNNFKKDFIYENINNNQNNNSLVLNLIDEEIERTLIKIKNVIESSLKEIKNIKLDGYYLKKHIINICEEQINLYNSTNISSMDEYIENNMIKLEYIKKLEENNYKEKIYETLIDNFKDSMKDYYSQYYNYEVIQRINLIYQCYFMSILQFSENFIKNKYDYLYLLLENQNIYDNSTYEKIINLPNKLVNIIENKLNEDKDKDIFYSNISYMKNKDSLINSFLYNIFNDEFMNRISLTNDLKLSFSYNDTILNILKNYTDAIIIHNSNSNLTNYYKIRKNYLLNNKEWYGQFINITKNVSNILANSIISSENNIPNIYNLLKKLERQFNGLEIKQKLSMEEEIFDIISKELEMNYKVNGIEKILYDFDTFSINFNQTFKNIIHDEINNLKNKKVNSYDTISDIGNEIINVLKNYSKYFLEETENYRSKLKYFAMIDGLNYIPIEKAESLRALWDNSPVQNKRNLENLKEKPKLLKFEKENKFFNKFDKKNKKEILLKMEKLMKNNFLRNLEEFNTRNVFNSTNDPLSLYSIMDMIDNLIDDINDFPNMIKESDFGKILLNYEMLNLNNAIYKDLLEIIEKLLCFDMSSFIPNSNYNEFDYIEELIINLINDNSQEILKKREKNLINSVFDQNSYKTLKETLTGIIISTYNAYSNVINNQTKVITAKDEEKHKKYSNSDKLDTLLEIINLEHIYEKPLDNIKKNIESQNDNIIYTIKKLIDSIDVGYHYGISIEITPDENNDHETIELNVEFNEDEFALKSCYVFDVIKLFNKKSKENADDEDYFPIKLKCPIFSFLQLRLTPILTFETCFNGEIKMDDDNKDIIKASVDFGIEANLGLNIEAGVYLEFGAFDISLTAGVDGIMYQGKLGINFKLQIEKAKISINVYIDYLTIAFKFYVKLEIKIVIVKIKPYISIDIKIRGGYEEIPFEYNLNDDYSTDEMLDYLL